MPIIDQFEKLSNIAHCSFQAEKLKSYIMNYAKTRGYNVQSDEAENILCSKGNPKIALQAHYDMVCVGTAPKINIVTENGWMKAENSSLGADNGLGVAYMLELINMGLNIEALFTANEEVGLIGANKLELSLKSKYLLNLDGKDANNIVIACAGGVNISANIKLEYEPINHDYKCYELSLTDLPGGHSGVQIHENIPNAIQVLSKYLNNLENYQLINFNGGDKRNVIPTKAYATIASKTVPMYQDKIQVKAITNNNIQALSKGKDMLVKLTTFKHGLWEFWDRFECTKTSANLAIVKQSTNEFEIQISGRFMTKEGFEQLVQNNKDFWQGYKLNHYLEYDCWLQEENEFIKIVKKYLSKTF